MTIQCPKHHIDLQIEDVRFSVPRDPSLAVVGSCPKCNVRYINRRLFPGTWTTIANIRYEFLQELSNSFPYDPSKEEQLRQAEVLQRQREEKKRKKEEARLEQLRKREEKRKKKLQQEEAWNRRHAEMAKAQWQQEEECKKDQEIRFQANKQEYIINPNKRFELSSISFFHPIPEQCPYDGESLVYLMYPE